MVARRLQKESSGDVNTGVVALWHVESSRRPRIEPTSPVLAGGFFTTGPPGESTTDSLYASVYVIWVATLTIRRDDLTVMCIERESCSHWNILVSDAELDNRNWAVYVSSRSQPGLLLVNVQSGWVT